MSLDSSPVLVIDEFEGEGMRSEGDCGAEGEQMLGGKSEQQVLGGEGEQQVLGGEGEVQLLGGDKNMKGLIDAEKKDFGGGALWNEYHKRVLLQEKENESMEKEKQEVEEPVQKVMRIGFYRDVTENEESKVDGHAGISHFWSSHHASKVSLNQLSPPTTPTYAVGAVGPSQATWDLASLGSEKRNTMEPSNDDDDDDGEPSFAQPLNRSKPLWLSGWDSDDSMPAGGERWSEEEEEVEGAQADDGGEVEEEEVEGAQDDDGGEVEEEEMVVAHDDGEADDEMWYWGQYSLPEESDDGADGMELNWEEFKMTQVSIFSNSCKSLVHLYSWVGVVTT